eukprot:15792-Heterococcus_DN1.PRE.6
MCSVEALGSYVCSLAGNESVNDASMLSYAAPAKATEIKGHTCEASDTLQRDSDTPFIDKQTSVNCEYSRHHAQRRSRLTAMA